MSSHDIDIEIKGEALQIVDVLLDQDETVIAEAGAMVYMEEGIDYSVKMGDGSDPNQSMMGTLFSAGKRAIAGESLFLTHFTNKSSERKKVCFAGNIPGSIIGIDLSKINGTLTCQRDAFLCAAYGTKVDIAFSKKLGAGLFGGEGFILEKLEGSGKAVLYAGGKVVKETLNGETIKVDPGCIVAFTEGIDYSIEKAGNLGSMIFGGEGLFFATLRGKGTVILQSAPISKMSNAILANAAGGSGTGKTALGDMSKIMDRLT